MNNGDKQDILFKEKVLLEEMNKTKINILNIEQSLKKLIDKRKSLSRFGGGELKIILQGNVGFQKYDSNLSIRLKEILVNNQNFCYIAIPDEITSFNNRIPEEKEYWINYLYSFRNNGSV